MEVSGPLSVITQGASFIEDMSSQASPSSASPFLAFAASLSVNLAALNALPLPALDGGQFLLALSELVSRRKIPRKLKANITAVSFLFLLVVTIWTSLGDISKLALLFR
ncbi:hypothetical protein EON64_03590 [archaeon]|nr:MAG: hypothetical protein EON64_03590 [archaeon]